MSAELKLMRTVGMMAARLRRKLRGLGALPDKGVCTTSGKLTLMAVTRRDSGGFAALMLYIREGVDGTLAPARVTVHGDTPEDALANLKIEMHRICENG